MIVAEWFCPNCKRKIEIEIRQDGSMPTLDVKCPICHTVKMELCYEEKEVLLTEKARRVWNDTRLSREDCKKVAKTLMDWVKNH